MIHFPRRSRRWRPAVTAVAGTMLLAACAGPAGTSAGTAISPASGPKQAGFAGKTGTPSALPSGGSSMSGMPMSAAPATAAAPVPADAVAIRNFAFGPQVATVKAGTTVHWTNNDTEAHTGPGAEQPSPAGADQPARLLRMLHAPDHDFKPKVSQATFHL